MVVGHEKLIFDTNKLRGRIVEKFGTISKFAERLDVHTSEISAKLNNRRDLTKKDMMIWAEVLEISKSEFGDYFFTLKFS